MDRDWLSQQMNVLSERVSVLLQQAHSNPSQRSELLPEVLAELGNSLEELRASQEVLHQQNHELLEIQIALERERQRYQELFDFAPDGYLITDTSGNIQQANQAASQLFNVSSEGLITKPLIVFVPESHRQAFYSELDRLPQVGRIQEWTIQLQPRDDSPFDASLTVTTIADRTGATVGLRWLVRDITERRQLEEAQLRVTLAEMTNRALETEIARRNRLEQKLRQQTESLTQANTLKDEFLAIVSHELRSPLNAILGWAQMLRNRQLNEMMVVRAFETIERNAKQQVKLIEDLLDISRIVRGKLHLDTHPVNLISVIHTAIDSVQLAATSKHIQLQTVLDESASLVSGDSDRLQQVIWNLLSNAIKFTPEGGRVEIKLESDESSILNSELNSQASPQHSTLNTQHSQKYAQISITDTGIGIRPDFLPYVFDRFRQAERATTRYFGGLGLGLAIVRQLVEMHGGTVTADSPGEGQGASFIVRLPLMATSGVSSATDEPPTTIATDDTLNPYSQLSNVYVLVVDDEADARELLTVVLERAGANVRLAASVNEALQVIQQAPPDVLISDVGMPEQDGCALIRQVRAIESAQSNESTQPNATSATNARRKCVAIALTAYAREEDGRRLLNAGFQLHLSKPIEPLTLITAVVSQVRCVS